MSKQYLSSPNMGKNELKYVQEAFESNWIAPLGPFVDRFEEGLANITARKNAVAMSSGTAAIHTALRLENIGEGDIVFCQALTFIASAAPIIYQQATPVFIDSEKETWNMCPKALEKAFIKYKKMGKTPKAVIIVDLYGMPAKIDEISQLCSEYNTVLIEDAAEALGSSYKGAPCGSFGKYSILSFNGNKIITTSGGGALLTDCSSKAKHALKMITQARDEAIHYEHSELGYNYRLSNVLAAIGVGQLEVLSERVQQKRQIFEEYKSRFSSGTYQPEASENYSNRWLTSLHLDESISSSNLIKKLQDNQIEARPIWKPMHLQPLFSNCNFISADERPVCEELFSNGVCLPSDTNLQLNEIKKTISIIRDK